MQPSNDAGQERARDISKQGQQSPSQVTAEGQAAYRLRELKRENLSLKSQLAAIHQSFWWRLGARLDRWRVVLGLKRDPGRPAIGDAAPAESRSGDVITAGLEAELAKELARCGALAHLDQILGARQCNLEDLRQKDPGLLFLVPFLGQGGGLHSIVQEVAALRMLGFRAAIATPKHLFETYREKYPDQPVFKTYEDEETLLSWRAQFTVFIATYFTSVALLEKLWLADPGLVCGYYVQDYEPWFFEGGSEWERLAYRTYGAIPGMIHFAKTQFLRETLGERHGLECHLVSPSLDHAVFSPPGPEERSSHPLVVTAMIRPNTPWRRPELTMKVLQALKMEFGERIRIETFGCHPEDPDFEALPRDFQFENLGVLDRQGMASLLSRASIFLDLSIYQAFGRTGLEAMACGCVPVLPEKCGPDSYAQQHRNAILINTGDERAAIEAVGNLVNRPDFRQRLGEAGLATAKQFSVPKAALEELLLFVDHLGAKGHEVPTR